MRNLFLAFLFLPLTVEAQSALAQSGVFVPSMSASATPAPPPSSGEVPFNPFRLSYFGEYQGPALGNFVLNKTQYPGLNPTYTEWDHYLKIGYALSKSITIGTQFRAFNSTDPNAPNSGFGFYDQRFYIQWNHMIDTSDISISGKFTVQPPTTDASRNSGEIVAFRIEANTEFKTALRNWHFTCNFLLEPYFYNDPVSNGGQTDIVLAAYPYITLDLVPNWQLLVEGLFDMSHNYNSAFYIYQSDDFDYVDVGPLITINSHINTNIALRFFTADVSVKSAAIYANIGVAL